MGLGIRVMIGDDEPGMRSILRKAIEKVDGFEIVAEGINGLETLELAEQLKPNVIFMDVEMPELNGVECAKRVLDINPKTIIIFATAHEEYMTDAFQLYAFDYLVKPFKMDRVFQTLDRIKALNASFDEEPILKIIRHDKGLDKLLVKNKEGISLIDSDEILIIQREDRSTVIYTDTCSYTTSEGLSELEERLDRTKFLRSHKSYIVNLSKINKIYPYGRWTYIVKLKNTDKDALLTHEKYEELRRIFEL